MVNGAARLALVRPNPAEPRGRPAERDDK